jgi:hypothetical protein
MPGSYIAKQQKIAGLLKKILFDKISDSWLDNILKKTNGFKKTANKRAAKTALRIRFL